MTAMNRRKKRWLPLLLTLLCAAGLLLNGCGYGIEYLVASEETSVQQESMIADPSGQDAAPSQEDSGQSKEDSSKHSTKADSAGKNAVKEDGTYTSPKQVAAYLHQYGHLPDNYITKKEAEALGWDSREGNLWEVADGKSIGGSRFGNYEGLLPDQKGRKWYECDVNYKGGYRGAERLLYSSDGLIYYTNDHYKTFQQLY